MECVCVCVWRKATPTDTHAPFLTSFSLYENEVFLLEWFLLSILRRRSYEEWHWLLLPDRALSFSKCLMEPKLLSVLIWQLQIDFVQANIYLLRLFDYRARIDNSKLMGFSGPRGHSSHFDSFPPDDTTTNNWNAEKNKIYFASKRACSWSCLTGIFSESRVGVVPKPPGKVPKTREAITKSARTIGHPLVQWNDAEYPRIQCLAKLSTISTPEFDQSISAGKCKFRTFLILLVLPWN